MNFDYKKSIDKSMIPEEYLLEGEKTPLLPSQTTNKTQKAASAAGLSSQENVRGVLRIGRQKIPKANIFFRLFSSIKNAIEEISVKRRVAKLTGDDIAIELENIRQHLTDTENEIYYQIDEEQTIDDHEFGYPKNFSIEQKKDIKALLKDLKKDLKFLKFYQERIDLFGNYIFIKD